MKVDEEDMLKTIAEASKTSKLKGAVRPFTVAGCLGKLIEEREDNFSGAFLSSIEADLSYEDLEQNINSKAV